MNRSAGIRWVWVVIALVLAAVVGVWIWQHVSPETLPPGFASGNGRIEAVEVDVATQASGRVDSIKVDEGDFVHAGEVLARMDTRTLDAQLQEAEAQLARAKTGVETARHQVVQRQSERASAEAVIAQRQAEQDAAAKRLARTRSLLKKGVASAQELDDDRAQFLAAQAAVSSAQAQAAAAEAAIATARSQVISAESAVHAAQATIDRIQSQIDDSTLKAPCDGRVQYRVAQPGEVLGAGGRVLNLVNLSDVYMTVFLPTAQAGRLAIGSEARIVLDAAPQYVLPAKVSYVASVAQFTPKTVETSEERSKLMFRVKVRLAPSLLKKYLEHVKTGLPGVAYVRLDEQKPWPAWLQTKLP